MVLDLVPLAGCMIRAHSKWLLASVSATGVLVGNWQHESSGDGGVCGTSRWSFRR